MKEDPLMGGELVTCMVKFFLLKWNTNPQLDDSSCVLASACTP